MYKVLGLLIYLLSLTVLTKLSSCARLFYIFKRTLELSKYFEITGNVKR